MPRGQMATAALVPPHPHHQGGGSGHPLVPASSSLCWVQGTSAQGPPGALQSHRRAEHQGRAGELQAEPCSCPASERLRGCGSKRGAASSLQCCSWKGSPGKALGFSWGVLCSVRAQPGLCLSFPIPADWLVPDWGCCGPALCLCPRAGPRASALLVAEVPGRAMRRPREGPEAALGKAAICTILSGSEQGAGAENVDISQADVGDQPPVPAVCSHRRSPPGIAGGSSGGRGGCSVLPTGTCPPSGTGGLLPHTSPSGPSVSWGLCR